MAWNAVVVQAVAATAARRRRPMLVEAVPVGVNLDVFVIVN